MKFNDYRSLYLLYFLTLCASILFIGAHGHDSDIGCWFSWTEHLQSFGYAGLNANYPPLYIHWLWVVAQWYTITQTIMEKDTIFKLLAMFPVIISHLLLVRLCYFSVKEHIPNKIFQWLLCIGTALNPAILFNGVIWGQVDIIPAVITLYALRFLHTEKQFTYVLPLTVAGLLCKFQMLVFVPVIGALVLKQPRKLPIGIIYAVATAVLILGPYLYSNNTMNMVHKAYIEAPSKYPYTTMNGANIWMVLSENEAPDSHIVTTTITATTFWQKIITPKGIGITLFIIASSVVFIKLIRRHSTNQIYSHATFLAGIFFLFCSGMHERYLFAAIPVSIIWISRKPQKFYIPLMLSLICYANMHLVINIETPLLWKTLSIMLFLILSLILVPDRFKRAIAIRIISYIPNRRIGFIPIAFVLTTILCLFTSFAMFPQSIIEAELTDNEQWVFSLPQIDGYQNFKQMQQNKTVVGNPLKVQDTLYLNGMGSHAPSRFTYALPQNATEFSAFVAIDDEAPKASVSFIVKLDSIEVWNSNELISGDSKKECSVSIDGHSTITLEMVEGENNNGDHANWLIPKIKTKS